MSHTWKDQTAFKRFTSDMAAVLDQKDAEGKRGWDDCDPKWLVKRIKEETKELELALEKNAWKAAAKEACDIANFCLFLHNEVTR